MSNKVIQNDGKDKEKQNQRKRVHLKPKIKQLLNKKQKSNKGSDVSSNKPEYDEFSSELLNVFF